jgi:hypothetical protein
MRTQGYKLYPSPVCFSYKREDFFSEPLLTGISMLQFQDSGDVPTRYFCKRIAESRMMKRRKILSPAKSIFIVTAIVRIEEMNGPKEY